jgi:SAM-dependent methyltransferase
MHPSSFNAMKYFVERYLDNNEQLDILDVGSYDVNGTYKPLFQSPNWHYVGLDVAEGPNVDIVSTSPYDFGLHKLFDVVISGNCLEHVESPWKWIKEVEKVTKKNGIICVITPFSVGEHRHPVDCWRILPDGYKYLLEHESTFTVIEAKSIYHHEIHSGFLKLILNLIPAPIKRILKLHLPVDTFAIARKN